MRILRLTASLAVALTLAVPAVAQSPSPKPRNSAADGIAATPESLKPAALSASAGSGQAVRPAAAAPAPAAQGVDAAPTADGGNAIRVDGTTTTNANGSGLSSTAIGGKNSGCNSIGSIAGQGC